MAIPDFQSCMLPLMILASDGKEHRVADAFAKLSQDFGLSEAELAEQLPSGRAPLFYNRVAWAVFYLRKAALLETPRRSYVRITPVGREALTPKPERIDLKFLKRFPAFVEFRSKRVEDASAVESDGDQDESAVGTPREILETAYQQLRTELASEIAQALKAADPAKFERIVVELLVRMGYGGSLVDAGRAIGRSGDEGIDGVIKEDHLGLDNIYVQAKKWENTVGRPEIQKFAGALQGQRARKGVFITTADFSKDAREYVQRIESKIVLIDGKSLCELMIDFNVGVSAMQTFELKRIDLDFFSDD
ncbi:MAG: restriction endonuclease [Panacagrimonas sp.]